MIKKIVRFFALAMLVVSPCVANPAFYTVEQADSLWWKRNKREMVLRGLKETEYSDLGDKFYKSLLLKDDALNISRLLVDYPTATAGYLYGDFVFQYTCLQNVREVWLSPKVDAYAFINELQEDIARYENYPPYSGGMMNGFCTIYVSDGDLPKGLLSYSSKPLSPVYFVKVYSGNVYEAFKKGDSAAKDWCSGHDYTGEIYTANRIKQHATCQQPNEWYYSCKWCGKCEYNPKHTFSDNLSKSPVHDFSRYDLYDKNYIGTNTTGEKVYCLSCRWCGINTRDADKTDLTYEDFIYNTGNKDSADAKEAYRMRMSQKQNNWKEGGQSYEMALDVSSDININPFSFAVPAVKDLSAKMSDGLQSDIRWAAQNDLIDESILGEDYTKPITRLQCCAISVRLAEKLLGKPISPMAAGTFSDTNSKYALKAAAAGISGGASGSKFYPNGIVDRQQLATFLYQALMYAKKNPDVRYTPYKSKLNRYSDAALIESWAKKAMSFMDALGLMEGTSSTKLSPATRCSIEQALVIANNCLDAPNIGWYQSIPMDTSKGIFRNDYEAQNGNMSTQLTYRPYERFWRPVAIPGKHGEGVLSERFAILDPYTKERLYVRKVNFKAIKTE